MDSTRPRWAVREVVAVCVVLTVVLLTVAAGYGPHRDELYFVAAGRHLAWGYPDQPSFTPALAWLMGVVAPGNLVVLRAPSLLAALGLVVLAVGFARLLGGGRAAQILTAVTVAASAFVVAIGHRLSTATFDTLAWAALLLIIGYLLVDASPRCWLLAGVVAGVGLNNKHAVAVLVLATLVGFALDRRARRQLATAYPWLGGLIAVVLWLPNLIWQASHGWPVRELSADIAAEYGGLAGRVGLLTEALLIFSPLIAVVWIWGLIQLLRRPQWRRLRPLAVIILLVSAAFVITGGKGYYLAGAILPLIAVGCTDLAGRWSARRVTLVGALLVASGLFAWPAVIPVLPVSTYAASFYPALNEDQLETIGWLELVATVRAAAESVPEQENLVVLTANYGEAGALEWYGIDHPVYSGHNGYGDWGPPPDRAGAVVVVGYADAGVRFAGCRIFAQIDNAAGARNEEYGRRVWICEAPKQPWSQTWRWLKDLRA